MTELKIIGIGCNARQGKMRVAKAIHCAIPERSWIFSFADSLKAYCRVNGWMGAKDSRLLQVFGTEIMRYVDPARWFSVLEHTLNEFGPDYGVDICLIPDVRFPNEAEWIKDRGGKLIKVERVMPDGSLYVDPTRSAKHDSERALDSYDGWDAVIREADGNLVGLAQKAVDTFTALTGITATVMAGESVLRDKAKALVLEGRRGFSADFHRHLHEMEGLLS